MMRKIIICENQFASLFKRSRLITENRASKNQSLARRMVKQLAPNLDDKDVTMKVLHDIPNVRKADFHLFPAAVRMVIEEGNALDGNLIQKLNKFIGIAAPKAKELGLDQNANGMSMDEFFNKFSQDVEQDDKLNKQAATKYDNGDSTFGGYDIVFIPDFKAAENYAEYVDWCVTYDEGNYDQYTNGETGYFYFFLKHGYQNITEDVGNKEEAPFDKYGLSMIAVSFYEDGSVNTITSRWNHELENGNYDGDHIMSVEDLCKLVHANIYQICVDKRPKNEVPSSWKLIKELPDNQNLYYDNDKKDYLVTDKNIRRVKYFEGKKAIVYEGFGKENYDALILTNGEVIGGKDLFIGEHFFLGNKLYVNLDFKVYEMNEETGQLTENPDLKRFSLRNGYIILANKDEKINILYPDSKQLFSKEWYDKLYDFRNLNVLQKDNFYAIIDIPEHKFVSDWMERQFFTGFLFVFKTKQNNLAVYKYGDNKPFAIVDDVVKIDFITIAVRKGMNYYSLSLPNSIDEISVTEITREEFDSYK